MNTSTPSASIGIPAVFLLLLALLAIFAFVTLIVVCIWLLMSRKSSGWPIFVVLLICGGVIGLPILFVIVGLISWTRTSTTVSGPASVSFSRGTDAAFASSDDSPWPGVPSPVVPPAVPPAGPDVPAPLIFNDQTGGAEATIYPDLKAVAATQPPSPPELWTSSDLNAFDADAYTSVSLAAPPLARKVRAALETNRLLQKKEDEPGWSEPLSVTIIANKLNAAGRSEVLSKFTEELQKQFPKTSISINDPAAESSAMEIFGNVVVLILSTENEQRETVHWDRSAAMSRGDLQCEIRTEVGRTSVDVRFVDKPWVEEFSSFAAAMPLRKFIAGYSTFLAPSESEARLSAIQDAIGKLRSAGYVNFTVNESLACDQFVQKLSRPYGDVWRVAMLFDLSSTQVALHAVASMKSNDTNTIRIHSNVRSIIGIFVLTTVLCVVINWLTQGYYRHRISLGVSMLVIGIIIVLGGLVLG
jgi:hypothetical protein